MERRPPLDELVSLLQSMVAAEGVTTAPGAAAGNSFIDAGLIGVGANSFISMLAVLYPGQPRLVDSFDITGFNNATGEVTLHESYKGVAAPIPAGVPYKIVTFRFVPAEVAAIAASLGLMAAAATADDLSDVTTTSAQAKLRRLLLRMSGAGIFSADIQGAARTELDTMLAQLATYFVAAGAVLSVTIDPGGAARVSLATLWNDLGQMLAGAAGITTWPAAAPPGNGISIAEALRQIYNDVVALTGAGILHEQADVPFNINAILISETNVLSLAIANTRYIVRSLRLKCVDPGVETVTVRLYELVNDVQTLVDTFAITTANFATAHSLMDMFGLEHLAGDNLKVTVIATAAGPYAVTGQYTLATATV